MKKMAFQLLYAPKPLPLLKTLAPLSKTKERKLQEEAKVQENRAIERPSFSLAQVVHVQSMLGKEKCEILPASCCSVYCFMFWLSL